MSTARYADRPLAPRVVRAVLDAVSAFARWAPPPGVLGAVFDYPNRIARYHALGFLDDGDRVALLDLFAQVSRRGAPCLPNHGDPISSNLLLTRSGEVALPDLEFTGFFLPGFDLAVLRTALVTTPELPGA
ncbi:hypothetical protein [Saccharomonospora sp.]|uniref:phosphotransferase family protein n=1 Tax=Saccharomonospora sp. TaxID=33913 RepID=UPI00262602EF|nr:hypothetical protein [Saccharomonospora sp.]